MPRSSDKPDTADALSALLADAEATEVSAAVRRYAELVVAFGAASPEKMVEELNEGRVPLPTQLEYLADEPKTSREHSAQTVRHRSKHSPVRPSRQVTA